jgi:hypothetical protein
MSEQYFSLNRWYKFVTDKWSREKGTYFKKDFGGKSG